jgi:hypothetical protein
MAHIEISESDLHIRRRLLRACRNETTDGRGPVFLREQSEVHPQLWRVNGCKAISCFSLLDRAAVKFLTICRACAVGESRRITPVIPRLRSSESGKKLRGPW